MGRFTFSSFDPEAHEQALRSIVEALETLPTVGPRSLTKILNRYPKARGECFSKAELIAAVRHFAPRYGWDAQQFSRKLRMKPVRTQSGLAPVTVLTQPFPCPGRCVFCPNDARVPKSYLPLEPTAQRATQNRFDPYGQTLNRLRAFFANGHVVDKVELIILGGNWSSYPERYRLWFVKRCLDALNDFRDAPPTPTWPDENHPDFTELALDRRLRSQPGAYNQAVADYLEQQPRAFHEQWNSMGWRDLEASQRHNEEALCRCVGIAVELRPDSVTPDEAVVLRRLGITKVQVGCQSLDDGILSLNRRGHDAAATRRAFSLLRRAGFKIHAHWMLNLVGSDPERDVADFARLFDEPDYRPDELKLYPCSLVAGTKLMDHYESGRWQPYAEDELCDVLAKCMSRVPPYCRVTRVMRDIPAGYIVAGTKASNLRERVDALLRERGEPSQDIRAREIRGQMVELDDLQLDESSYATSIGRECFLQFIMPDGRVAAFLRLSLPEAPGFVPEIEGRAIIREVHAYGLVAGIETPEPANAQHLGLGRRLVEHACTRARAEGYGHIAVISSVGTRPYYRRLGFADGVLYQHRALDG